MRLAKTYLNAYEQLDTLRQGLARQGISAFKEGCPPSRYDLFPQTAHRRNWT